MQSGNNNRLTVDTAAARDKMNAMKYEIANEIGVDLKKGYNGELTSKEAGYVGGYMVKRMIEEMERSMANK
ncbi:MAG: alpha/beta-type small acid-soluble spore protein [Clostridia bacterium]|nr:alpha/beta-type small acid-soluble spore protein [Clostridia bacterium]